MLKELKRRENLYLIPLIAIMLDWGSTILAMQYNSKFTELNPIGQVLGFNGIVFYAIGMMAMVTLFLFKWGIHYAANGEKRVFLTDWLAIAIAAQGIAACLNNFGIISVTHTVSGYYAFGQMTFICAAVVSFFINHRLFIEQFHPSFSYLKQESKLGCFNT